MAVNVNTLSPAKLKELRSGDKIAIRFARTQEEVENGASRILYEQFPKRVATAFSTKWAAMFPSVNKQSLMQISQPKRTSVTIVGGSAEIVRMILTWILSCCDGGGLQEWPLYTDKPFSKYFIVKETADHLGVAVISKEMGHRLEAIASKQIHSEDVQAMYIRLPHNHPMLKDIAAHVAELIFNNQLKAFGAYRTLREEIPQFDRDINEVLEPRVQVRREERLKEKEARQAEREAKVQKREQAQKGRKGQKGQKGPDASRGNRVRPNIDGETLRRYTYTNTSGNNRQFSSSQATNTAPNTAQEIANDHPLQHKTLRCSVARKAQGGRPAYVSLSLADAGVNKDEFTGDAFLPPAPKLQRRERSSIRKHDDNKTEANDSSLDEGDVKKEQVDDESETASSLVTTNKKGKDQDDKVSRYAATAETTGRVQQSSIGTASQSIDHLSTTSTSPASRNTITTVPIPTDRDTPSTTASSATGSVDSSELGKPTSVAVSTSTSAPSSTLNSPLRSSFFRSTPSTPVTSPGTNTGVNTNTTTTTTSTMRRYADVSREAAANATKNTVSIYVTDANLRSKQKPKAKVNLPARTGTDVED